MKKKLTALIILFLVLCNNSNAQNSKENELLPHNTKVIIGGLSTYEPFLWTEVEQRFLFGKVTSEKTFSKGFFPELTKQFFSDLGIHKKYIVYKKYETLEELNSAAENGKIDFVIGVYYSNNEYLNYELLYPSIYVNPITAFLRIEDINNVSNWDDINKLDTVLRSDEKFSDLYNDDIKNNLKITMVKNAYEAFKALLNNETDCFLTSVYSGQAEGFKMGLLDRVTFIKRPKWKDNFFIGIAKGSKLHDIKEDVIKLLKKYKKKHITDTIMLNVMQQWKEKNKDFRFKRFKEYEEELTETLPASENKSEIKLESKTEAKTGVESETNSDIKTNADTKIDEKKEK